MSEERTNPKLVAGLLLLIVVSLGVIAGFKEPGTQLLSRHGDPGTIDFIQYWSAHKLMLQGENPYDPDLLYAIEVAQGLPDAEPIMMWNPPWLVTVLMPVLGFPFLTSATLWMGINIVLIAITGVLINRAYAGDYRPAVPVIFAMFFFYPNISTLHFGQLGLVYAVAMAAFIFAVERDDDWLAGLALIPPTVKPHLIYLVLILLVYWILRERKWKVVLSFSIGFSMLLLATWLMFPAALGQWIDAFGSPPYKWKVGTLVGITRVVIDQVTGTPATWPMVVIPGIATVAFVGWLVARRPPANLLYLLPPVLALSLFSSPYGWLFDQSQLLLVQVGLVAMAARPSVPSDVRRATFGALAAIQVVAVAQNQLGLNGHEFFFWTTFALFAVWVVATKRMGFRLTSDAPRGAMDPAGAPS